MPSLTDADLEVLAFLAEHRVVVTTQVQELLGAGPRAATGRLRALEGERLIDRRRIFEGQPEACWITRRGLGVIGCGLPAPRVDLKGYRHDIGTAWVWLAARDGAFGPLREQVSERTMRSRDGRPGREGPAQGIGVGEVGPGGRARLHYPDLMLETSDGHRVAVELELTGKSARRLDRIMLGYAADARVDAVLYLCPPGRVGERVQQAARRAGLGHRIHVQALARAGPAGCPEPAHLRARGLQASRERSDDRRGVDRC